MIAFPHRLTSNRKKAVSIIVRAQEKGDVLCQGYLYRYPWLCTIEELRGNLKMIQMIESHLEQA